MVSITPEQFKRFQKLIYDDSGIRLDDRKLTLLASRLQRRLRKIGVDDIDVYFRMVTAKGGKEERQHLLDAITTNETSFYRTPQHFEWFAKEFLPDIAKSYKNGERKNTLRIWSAACSTGPEPYTLTFCLNDYRAQFKDWTINVMGSDLSLDSLELAREATYNDRVMGAQMPNKSTRYFQKSATAKDMHEVRPEYRDQVEFFHHNLMTPLNRPPMDCIFLRNVLIYFDEKSKEQVLQNMANSLVPGGYLVVGPSEGIFGLDNPLTKRATFLYQKT